jgi:hypothetical protein
VCQWQVAQICAAQIRPAQIYSCTSELSELVPIDGAAPIHMGCQQPLNVGTIQFDILKRIDALLQVRFDSTTFSQVRLAFGVNVRFSAPGLPPFPPIPMPGITVLRIWTLL